MLSWWSCQLPVVQRCGLLNHLNSFCRGMFKLNAKCDADPLLYSFSHFECDDHMVHMLTQWCLLPPLTRTVKSSLFTHEHSSPLSLAARLHQCHANCSCHINNGWTFSKQTSYNKQYLKHSTQFPDSGTKYSLCPWSVSQSKINLMLPFKCDYIFWGFLSIQNNKNKFHKLSNVICGSQEALIYVSLISKVI